MVRRGGGAPIPQIAALIDGCIGIAINPSIRIERSTSLYGSFANVLGCDPVKSDKFNRGDMAYWIKNYPSTKFIFIENILSLSDREDICYLAKKLNMNLSYGIEKKDNVIVWCYAAMSEIPHNAQEDQLIYFQIMFLTKFFENNLDIEDYKQLYLHFSEQWYNKYKLLALKDENEKFIYDLNTSNDKVFEYELQNIKVEPTNNIYHNHVIAAKLAPNSIYKVTIEGLALTNSNDNVALLALKDNENNRIVWSRDLVCDIAQTYTFMTKNNIKSFELRIYAGKPGATGGIGMTIKRVLINYIMANIVK